MHIVGYQFPEEQTAKYDADWLRVAVTVKHPKANWHFTDSCLLTWELQELGRWLGCIGRGEVERRTLSFTEPNIAFELLPPSGESDTLRISFTNESAPPFLKGDNRYEGFGIDLPLADLDLNAAADAIRLQAQAFPTRAGH